MPEPITIPISVFELTVRYQKPVIRLLADRFAIVQALFDAFAEFEPNADDMEIISTGKTTEQGIRLRLASQKITFFFGATHCKITRESAVWADADAMLSTIDLFLTTLVTVSHVVLGRRTSVVSLHLQPKTASFKDILRPFIDPRLKALDSEPLKAMAIVARWPNHRITLDGSAQIANGTFVQMEREFDPQASYEEMKNIIFSDEFELLKLLGVEEVEE
jgi:hypothetical protein